MSLNDITFIKGQGGLGTPLAGKDHYSGIIFYSASLPTGFSSSDRIQQFFSIDDAESAGITETLFPTFHYHISEYFRINDQGVLWCGVFAIPGGSYTFSEITTMQNFANGEIRQIGIYTTKTFSTSDVTTINSVCADLETDHKPLSALYSADMSTAGASVSVYPDLTSLDANKVSVVIGQDGAGIGAGLASTSGKSISCIGACLGAVSKAKVSENIGWVGKFNMVTDTELDVLALTNGTLIRTLTDSALLTLKDKGYVFLRKRIGISGSFFEDDTTATLSSSDYVSIANNRTIDKAIRNVRTNFLPFQNFPVDTNEDGTLTTDFIKFIETVCQKPLTDMINNAELSAGKVIINASQNVLSTSILAVTIKLVPKGVARHIVINIGFTVAV